MKEQYVEAYKRTKTPGIHHTKTGTIRYEDKRHRKWRTTDVVRLLVRVNNESSEQDIINQVITWRAIYKIAHRNYLFGVAAEEAKNGPELQNRANEYSKSLGKDFEKFLKGFDTFVKIAGALLGLVPGAGEIVSFLEDVYFLVRKYFPVV